MDTVPPVSGMTIESLTHSPRQCRWLIAVATASVVLLHFTWLFVAMRPTTELTAVTRSERLVPPEIAYLGPVDSASSQVYADVRRIRSPVLFALPTRIGFSGPMLANPDDTLPPRMLPEDPLRIRQLERPFSASPFGASSRDLAALMDMPRPLPVPKPYAEAEAVMPVGRTATNMFMVYWQDRPERLPENIPVTDPATWVGKTPWSMTLFVCFDQDGLIRQVMVEKPSPYADVTAAVLRIARGMVFGTPLFGDCGRLVVVYRPADGGAE